MPSVIKRKTSHVAESAFKIYAGDEPRPGGYRGILKQLNMVKSKGDNLMFTAVVEFEAKDGSDKKQFDGYATFPQIPLTDNESNIQREQALYVAVCGKMDADIKVDGTPEKFKAGDGQKAKVVSINGVKPEGKVVNVRMRYEIDNREGMNGAQQLRCDLIFAARGESPVVDEEDDIEDDEETDEEGLPLYEEDDLKTKNLVALRKILVDELDQDAAEIKAEKSKAALIELILELQEDEEEDEDEEDEEETDEEEDEDKEAEIREEVDGMDRNVLKAAIKKRDSAFRVLKSTTDEALREALVALMLQDPPF